MTSTRFCPGSHGATEPRRLLEANGAATNSENEYKADPEQTSDVDSTQKPFLLTIAFPAWSQECTVFYP